MPLMVVISIYLFVFAISMFVTVPRERESSIEQQASMEASHIEYTNQNILLQDQIRLLHEREHRVNQAV